MLPRADPATAHAFCENVRQLIGQHPWDPITAGLPITVSIGHTTATPPATVASLLGAADSASTTPNTPAATKSTPSARPVRLPSQGQH